MSQSTSANRGGWLDRYFGISEMGSTIRRECIGGVTTFLTMSYIIFLQPTLLSAVGMDRGAVMVATCLSSALATLMMGVWAKYPIALAPGMGQNFFFTFAVCIGLGVSWQTALGAVFISGMLFVVLAPFGFRERIISAIPESLKFAIAAGIGLMISLVGAQWGGLVVPTPPGGSMITLGPVGSKPVLIALLGILVIGVLLARRVRGAILIGTAVAAFAAWFSGVASYQGAFSLPPSVMPTLLQLDILGALTAGMGTVIFVFLLLDVFDTVGTLVGVTEAAGLTRDGKIPRVSRALLSDAAGTVVGALTGTSTVTSYIESAAGVSDGARTGLASVVTALLFLVALFFYPLVVMCGEPYTLDVGNGIETQVRPILAPAILIVGLFMVGCVKRIDWDDPTEGLPAFLTIIFMPFGGLSPTEGIAFGFISYTLLKLLTGRYRELHPLMAVFALLFVVKYAVV